MLLALLVVVALAPDAGLGDGGAADGGAGMLDGGLDGGAPARFSAEIYGSCPVAGDAPPAVKFGSVQADGGVSWMLPHPRGPRLSCLLEACETDRALKEVRADSNEKFVIGFSVGASAAVTLMLGVMAARELTR